MFDAKYESRYALLLSSLKDFGSIRVPLPISELLSSTVLATLQLVEPISAHIDGLLAVGPVLMPEEPPADEREHDANRWD